MVGIGTNAPNAALDVEGLCVTGDTLLPIRRRRKKKKGEPDNGTDSTEGNVGTGAYEYLLVQIKDVVAGDEVLSLNESTGLVEYRRIKALVDMGVKQVYELRTKSGRVIRTTANHPYLARLKMLNGKNLYNNNYNNNNNIAPSLSLGGTRDFSPKGGEGNTKLFKNLMTFVSRIAGAKAKNGESREILTQQTRDMGHDMGQNGYPGQNKNRFLRNGWP